MTVCRICRATLNTPVYVRNGPALTSICTILDVDTVVYLCENCGHVQTNEFSSVETYYDTEYKISMQSDEHDQLYDVVNGKPVYRTEKQTVILQDIGIPTGAKILDYGAAKGETLARLYKRRPDIYPYLFDVSDDYKNHWGRHFPESKHATYQTPMEWNNYFDLITAHFVLEHVEDPVGIINNMCELLAPKGRIFFTVPDPIGNPGDLLVVDHLSHFTINSIVTLLQRSGLSSQSISQDVFRGAHTVVAVEKHNGNVYDQHQDDLRKIKNYLESWARILNKLERQVKSNAGKKTVIYGAGFYGALIASRMPSKPFCFLDRNPHLQGQQNMGCPVFSPSDCVEDVEIVYVGLNPFYTNREYFLDAEWVPISAKVIYLDE